MDNAEEILQALEEFSKLKPKDIPKELDEYLGYVAKTGDPVYQWQLVKHLFHEKLANVIKDFYETSPTIDLPPCPNVDPFNYERLKTSLLERLDTFSSAPFTVQRICELLTNPRKQYNRVDKFMRAIEKNILVVSTREPGIGKRIENDQTETVLNGVPDKVNESQDRIINVSSDNLQFSNSTDSTQIPVENAVNACVIQEEIEIENSVSASTTVITESWCETNENDKDTDLVGNTEINISTTSTSLPNSELPKNTNILFTENGMKSDTEKGASHNILCNEPIGSSTPDSPQSPDPSNSENVCSTDESLNDESVLPETSENEDRCSDIKENDEEDSDEMITEPSKSADDTTPGNSDETVDGPLVSKSSTAESPQISTEKIDASSVDKQVVEQDVITEASSPKQDVTTEPSSPEHAIETEPLSPECSEKTEPLSPECDLKTEPLSPESGVKTKPLSPERVSPEASSPEHVTPETSLEPEPVQIETSSPERVVPYSSDDSYCSGDVILKENSVNLQNEKNTTNNSNPSSTEQNISTEIPDITSEKTNSEKESIVGESVIKESEEVITSEIHVEDSKKVDEIKCKVGDTPSESTVIDKTAVAASGDSVSVICIRSGVLDSKKHIDEAYTTEQDEIVDDISDDQDKEQGSIKHATPNNTGTEVPTSMTAVEDICVDQTSCSTEDEAMDIDESSNHQMITSEGENEVEPMDQSDVQMQS